MTTVSMTMTTKYERWAESNLDVKERVGNELLLICMFHDDHSPSLYFNRINGLWLCHACGERGNFQNLRQRLFGDGGLIETVATDSIEDVMDSIKRLEAEDGTVEPYPETYLMQFEQPTSYWAEERGLSSEVIEKFELGWDSFSNDYTIPIRAEGGDLLGVMKRRGGKLMKGTPRYSYPKGVKMSNILFGSWVVTSREIYITEGAIDAISLWDVGVQAVALGGVNMSDAHARTIQRLGITRVIVFPDNPNLDGAAEELVRTTVKKLRGTSVRAVHWGNQNLYKDVNDVKPEHRTAMLGAHIEGTTWLKDANAASS